MADLSPAAQAVLDAYHEEAIDYIESWGSFSHKRGMAAALRAVEEQLSLDPRDKSPLGALFSCSEQLLAIAAELESTSQQS
jgi:hypothetical protein